MLDSKGVIHSGRDDLNAYKQEFAIDTEDRTLEDALNGADMMLGLSSGNLELKIWKEYGEGCNYLCTVQTQPPRLPLTRCMR